MKQEIKQYLDRLDREATRLTERICRLEEENKELKRYFGVEMVEYKDSVEIDPEFGYTRTKKRIVSILKK